MRVGRVTWPATVIMIVALSAGCNESDSDGPTGGATAVPITPTTTPVGTATLHSTCDWGQKIVGCDG